MAYRRWVQTFAFWIDDKYRGAAAWDHFLTQYRYFCNQYLKYRESIFPFNSGGSVRPGICNTLLSIEGAAPLEDKIERVEMVKKMGISMITLTWNGDNALASGSLGSGGGLTSLGKEMVKEMEYRNIIVDVSHLSDNGFADVEKLASVPFIATHSNARAVESHPRNLTDEQIKCIIGRRGLIGINFYPVFVNGKKDYDLAELHRHIDHFLSLGGEKVLALGSDFDGASMPSALNDIKGLEKLYRSMIECYGNKTADRVFFENAERFFSHHVSHDFGKESVFGEICGRE